MCVGYVHGVPLDVAKVALGVVFTMSKEPYLLITPLFLQMRCVRRPSGLIADAHLWPPARPVLVRRVEYI